MRARHTGRPCPPTRPATRNSCSPTRPATRDDGPHPRAAGRGLGLRMKEAVGALPAAQREAFLLQHEGGMSLAEIAELTGAGVETVKSRLRYAMNKLRSDLSDLVERES